MQLQLEVAAFMKQEAIAAKGGDTKVAKGGDKAKKDQMGDKKATKQGPKLSSLQTEVQAFSAKLHAGESEEEEEAGEAPTVDTGAAKTKALKLVKSGGTGKKWWESKAGFRAGKKYDPKSLRARAMEVLKVQSEAYEGSVKSKGSTDQKYLRTVVRTGTLTDRMAAMSLIVQECPLLAHKALMTLTGMAKKTGSSPPLTHSPYTHAQPPAPMHSLLHTRTAHYTHALPLHTCHLHTCPSHTHMPPPHR